MVCCDIDFGWGAGGGPARLTNDAKRKARKKEKFIRVGFSHLFFGETFVIRLV